jgi:two-component system sensor histidine kinase/response regulator
VTRHTLRERRRRLHILLAEDNAINQRLAVRLLEKGGHEVKVATTGVEALAALDRERFDLVLMDVQMPELSGLEATQRIREREAAIVAGTAAAPPGSSYAAPGPRRLPVVAMTAHAMRGDRERCLEAGMDDYVSKPMKPEELGAAISRVVGHEPEAPDREAASPVDLDLALSHTGGDADLLRELVDLFTADTPARLGRLEEAVRAGDAAQVLQLSHHLRGALSHLGATESTRLVGALEAMAREGRLGRARPLLEDLEVEVQRVEAFFAEPPTGGDADRRPATEC